MLESEGFLLWSQEEKVSKVLEKFAVSIKEVDVNLSVSKGKGGEKHKCEITVFMLRMGVVPLFYLPLPLPSDMKLMDAAVAVLDAPRIRQQQCRMRAMSIHSCSEASYRQIWLNLV